MWLYKADNGLTIILHDENVLNLAEQAGLQFVGECDSDGNLLEPKTKKAK